MRTTKKIELRKDCWIALRVARAVRFPGVEGRIPNFIGAEAAADVLMRWPAWKRASIVQFNPDSPQRPLRHRALKQGKKIYLAVPELAGPRPFIEIDPRRMDAAALWAASSIVGAFQAGRPVSLAQMRPVDLIVTGCVGAGRDGARLGKGGGASDLEYALLREADVVTARTPIATTVHQSQLLKRGKIPMAAHDISLDVIATPVELVECPRKFRRPRGVNPELLGDEQREAIPMLRKKPRRSVKKPRKSRLPRKIDG